MQVVVLGFILLISPHRFIPAFIRLGSWNVVMFVCFEQIKRAMTEVGGANPMELIRMSPKSPVDLHKLKIQQVNNYYSRDPQSEG